MSVELRYVRDHIEVYCGVDFLFSADTMSEARQELEDSGYSI